MYNISIIGIGYVGLTVGTCLASFGNNVKCYDIDNVKINRLKKGIVPFYEPELEGLLKKVLYKGRLQFVNNLKDALEEAQFVFISVGTPTLKNGDSDLRAYFSVVRKIGLFLKRNKDNIKYKNIFIVNKSTVPVGTARKAHKIIKEIFKSKNFIIVSNPEFLREGTALKDFICPDRVIIGSNKERNKLQDFLRLYNKINCPKLIVNWETAEMIKYASNAFLATKISFINEIANVCDRVGADVLCVAKGMGFDKRIGESFLKAGIGYGGSCFPKDVKALQKFSLNYKYKFKLLKSVIEVNNLQRELALKKITDSLGGRLRNKKIAVLGVSFKPNTDDIRESASIFIIKRLLKSRSVLKIYDPQALSNARKSLSVYKNIVFSRSALSCTRGVDAVFLATDWDEFVNLDWEKVKALMRGNVIVDGRNALDRNKLKQIGFNYIGFGVV